MDNGDPRLPYPRFLRVPFVFVPKGSPPPLEWMAAHPNHVTIPAVFIPRAPTEPEQESQPEARTQFEPPPEGAVCGEPAPGVEPKARGPAWQWIVPPAGPKRPPGRPPRLGPRAAQAKGMNLGRDICSAEFTRDLVRRTMRLLAALDQPSVRYPGIMTPEGFQAAVHDGLRRLAAHKGDARAGIAAGRCVVRDAISESPKKDLT